MDPTIAAALAAAVAGALGALGGGRITWRIAQRKMSGNVNTSDADRVWEQTNKLISAYADDNAHLRERLTELDRRLWDMTKAERECSERYGELEKKYERLERMLKIDLGANNEADISAELGG